MTLLMLINNFKESIYVQDWAWMERAFVLPGFETNLLEVSLLVCVQYILAMFQKLHLSIFLY